MFRSPDLGVIGSRIPYCPLLQSWGPILVPWGAQLSPCRVLFPSLPSQVFLGRYDTMLTQSTDHANQTFPPENQLRTSSASGRALSTSTPEPPCDSVSAQASCHDETLVAFSQSWTLTSCSSEPVPLLHGLSYYRLFNSCRSTRCHSAISPCRHMDSNTPKLPRGSTIVYLNFNPPLWMSSPPPHTTLRWSSNLSDRTMAVVFGERPIRLTTLHDPLPHPATLLRWRSVCLPVYARRLTVQRERQKF